MWPRTLARPLCTIALSASLVVCAMPPAGAAARRFGYVGLTRAWVDGEPRGLLGLDGMIGVTPRSPVWLVGGMGFHLSAASRYTFGGQAVGHRMLYISAGPQVMHPWRKYRLVGHILAGYTQLSYNHPGSASDSLTSRPAGEPFALDVGGRAARPLMASGYYGGAAPALVHLGGFGFAIGLGVDVFVGRRSAIRILQLEYMPSRLRRIHEFVPPGLFSPPAAPEVSRFAEQVAHDHGGWTHSFRVSAGFVRGPGPTP